MTLAMIKKYALPFFVLALLAFALYGRTLNYPFVFDDQNVIIENPTLRYLSSIPSFFTTLSPTGENDTTGLYRPILYSSFTINYYLSGLNTFSYHLFDVLLHIINSFLIFLVIIELQKLTKNENRAVALLFAALFCVHPVLTQSVIYLSARSVLIMTFFCLGSFLFYIKYRTDKKAWLLAASAALFGCALLTKESSPVFIGVIFLLELFFQKEQGNKLKGSFARITPFAAAALIFVAARLIILSKASETLVRYNYIQHWLAEVSILPRYIALVVNPSGLCVEHYVPDARITDGWFLTGVATIAVSSMLFSRFFKKDRLLACLFAWPFLALLPEMVVPLPERMVEYRLYLPMAGIMLFIATAYSRWAVGATKAAVRYTAIAVLCIIVLSGVMAVNKSTVWASPRTLWVDATSKNPDYFRPYHNLGDYLFEKGEYVEAIQALTKSIMLNPKSYKSYNTLGLALSKIGNTTAAKQMLGESLRINPEFDNAYNNLGNIYFEEGSIDKAIPMYLKALEINRFNYKAYYNLGFAYLESGAYQDAFDVFVKMAVNCPERGESKKEGADLLNRYGQHELASKLMESQ